MNYVYILFAVVIAALFWSYNSADPAKKAQKDRTLMYAIVVLAVLGGAYMWWASHRAGNQPVSFMDAEPRLDIPFESDVNPVTSVS